MTELCSATSRSRVEPLMATASRVDRWLLVEHRGAWGPQAVPSSRMARPVARHLAQLAAGNGARLLMVRRPAGVDGGPGRQVFTVDSRPGHEAVSTLHVATDPELLELSFDGSEWQSYNGPLYLVCTHGRHDRCCAVLGRPVAKALSQRHPDRTWESSHVGGDRFAANLVVLPEGLYLGRLAADEAVAVVDALSAGRLPTGRVRGRSSLPLPTQAAQAFAREELSREGVDELAVVAQTSAGVDEWRVRLTRPDVEVVVRYDRAGYGERHRLTCDAEREQVAPLFRRVSLTPLDPG